MRLFFISVLMAVFTVVSASSVIGLVQQISGSVKVKGEGSLKKSSVQNGLEIKRGDLITTAKNATAVLKLVDGSLLALDTSSSLYFPSDSAVEQKTGKIYYKITSRDAKNSLKITTPFAIIGIKGTAFIVNATEDASVKLKEGVIGIKSIKEEFELYRKEVQKQFDDFVSKQQNDFEKFKQEQNRGIAEVTKEFDLEALNSVSFSGKIVSEKSFGEDDNAEFTYFEKLISSRK